MIGSPSYDAVLFDLDGVLTPTASLHAACWKRVLDEVLAVHGGEPFDEGADYLRHVDGRSRDDGARAFLRSRGIDLPEDEVAAIGDRKQALVEDALAHDGVEAFPGSVRLVRHLRGSGTRTAVVSSSANARAVLRAAGIDGLFDAIVDGRDIAALGLRGKPAADPFLEAARRLEALPSRAVVVEDARSGVAAGRAGGFGVVIGVARNGEAAALADAGAHLVVADLSELVP